ncbi:hypothetical protein NC651_019678 [Populus alba x Populus x berolinensis]|nr:hypothetical protein NC651_019678 [Populus alba x Populus x berolinensis]
MTSPRLLYSNGIVFHPPNTTPIHTYLESNSGSYTITRTHIRLFFELDLNIYLIKIIIMVCIYIYILKYIYKIYSSCMVIWF